MLRAAPLRANRLPGEGDRGFARYLIGMDETVRVSLREAAEPAPIRVITGAPSAGARAWAGRVILAGALIFFCGLTALLGGIAALELLGDGHGDQLVFMPAMAAPFCGLLAFACWRLLVEDFR